VGIGPPGFDCRDIRQRSPECRLSQLRPAGLVQPQELADDELPRLFFGRSRLDFNPSEADNSTMELNGLVQNGVIVLSGGASLPEGTPVTVSCSLEAGSPPPSEKKRVQLPLVRTGEPGSMHLTNERIA